MWVYIPGLYSLTKKTKKKKKKTHFTSFMNFNHFGKTSIVPYKDSKCSEVSQFCLTYNTLIIQINNTICHIFNYPFFTFFYFCLFFHLFLGNLSLINNHINNICDFRSPSYNKLVHRDKNDNVILNLTRIS